MAITTITPGVPPGRRPMHGTCYTCLWHGECLREDTVPTVVDPNSPDPRERVETHQIKCPTCGNSVNMQFGKSKRAKKPDGKDGCSARDAYL